MKIEIFTRNTDKKAEIMTYLRDLNNFHSSSGKVTAEWVEGEFTGSYILLTVKKIWLAEELIRKLFTVKPVPFANGFYEIDAGQRIIVTCAARPVVESMNSLDVLEHLDVEEGELAGRLETRWASRDVGISADFEILIQGGIVIARIKFATHFRESDYYCKKAVSMVSLSRGLSAVCARSSETARPPSETLTMARAAGVIGEESCSDLLNRCTGKIIYREEDGKYVVTLAGSENAITLSKKREGEVSVELQLREPWKIGREEASLVESLLNIDRVQIIKTITFLTVSPGDLLNFLGFTKEKEFSLFRASMDGLEAKYDIGLRTMQISSSLAWGKLDKSAIIFSSVEEFAARVKSYAV